MDDTCAVCADNLEWVAYGACGHREVCSTCVARLRFICDDRRCCICKTESDVVFVTKALGDYTRMINDFSLLPSEPKEGRVGSYWYHESTGAFFDDVDHYRMIKAMCKLSCTVCDKMEEKSNDASKRRRFWSIRQLNGHLFHNHRLYMCSLCLEGRKVFICEQKLYTRSQLNQHISTGDSEVDGDESERGGFTGHPICHFCRNPFYGDNELYTHMSTEHYTCFICQRQNPGQYEYFKNYDDLEIHFRQEHFLCEDESCLAKKFVVFQSEAEIKRHNTLEHGGRMSRSKRNAALQIPTSFQYRRSGEDRRRGRGQTFQRDFADDQLSMAIQASLETANADGSNRNPSSSSSAQVIKGPVNGNDMDDIIQPFESLTTTDSEASSRYLQALGHNSSSAPLQEAAFPPLATASGSQQIQKHDSEGSSTNSMAAHLRRKSRNVSVSSPSQAWPAASRPSPSIAASRPSRQTTSNMASQPISSTGNGPPLTSYANLAKGQNPGRAIAKHGISSVTPISSRSIDSTSRISHSASAPNLVERGSVEVLTSDFPPVSAVQVRKAPNTGQVLPKVEDVHAANKSLVEKIQAALDNNEEKYTAFKEISGHYRQGAIDTETYLDYVQHFGLPHLILDLARLLPDSEKQKELLHKYNASMRTSDPRENGRSYNSLLQKDNVSKKGKGKIVDAVGSSQRNLLADNIMSTVRELQSNNRAPDQDVEVLLKDGYRPGKVKSKLVNPVTKDEQQVQEIPSESSLSSRSNQNLVDGGGGSKQRKKTSKFHRLRLGEDSTATILNLKNSDPEPDPLVKPQDSNENPASGLPLHGAWRKGGGQKLLF